MSMMWWKSSVANSNHQILREWLTTLRTTLAKQMQNQVQKTKIVKHHQKNKKRVNKYTIYNGYIRILVEDVVTKSGSLHDSFVRHYMDVAMREEFKCSCPLSFYGGIRANKDFFVAYAFCLIFSHKAWYKFDILEIDSNVLEIHVSGLPHYRLNTPKTRNWDTVHSGVFVG